MDDEQRLEALEAENERLRDELDRLRDNLGQTWLAPLELGLTGAETRIAGRLLKGGLCSKEHLLSVCALGFGEDDRDIKIVDVYICKVRKKLKRFGIEISTRWGLGYEMAPTMIEKFRKDWGDGANS